jgi:hypothetical protein
MPLCTLCCANTQDSPPPSISNTEWEATMFAFLNLLTRDCCCYLLSGEEQSSEANNAALSYPKFALAPREGESQALPAPVRAQTATTLSSPTGIHGWPAMSDPTRRSEATLALHRACDSSTSLQEAVKLGILAALCVQPTRVVFQDG